MGFKIIKLLPQIPAKFPGCGVLTGAAATYAMCAALKKYASNPSEQNNEESTKETVLPAFNQNMGRDVAGCSAEISSSLNSAQAAKAYSDTVNEEKSKTDNIPQKTTTPAELTAPAVKSVQASETEQEQDECDRIFDDIMKSCFNEEDEYESQTDNVSEKTTMPAKLTAFAAKSFQTPESAQKQDEVSRIEHYFSDLFNKYYEEIRKCNPGEEYIVPEQFKTNVEELYKYLEDVTNYDTDQNGYIIDKKYQLTHRGHWLWFYHSDSPLSVKERVYLNVHVTDDLLQNLEYFVDRCKKKGVNIDFKITDTLKRLNGRHEPVIMYFDDFITEETESEIVEIATPYVRTNADNEKLMINDKCKKLADGIIETPEPTLADVEELCQEARDAGFGCFADGIMQRMMENGEVHTSPGQTEAYRRLIKANPQERQARIAEIEAEWQARRDGK